jgi:hypothetical protein
MIVFDRKELLRVAEAVRSKDHDYLVENIKFCDCYEELETDISAIVSPEKITFELKVMCVDRENKNIKKSETYTFDVPSKSILEEYKEIVSKFFNKRKITDASYWFYCHFLDFLEENECDDVIVRFIDCSHVVFQIGDNEENVWCDMEDNTEIENEKDWYEIEIENYPEYAIVKHNYTGKFGYRVYEFKEPPDDWMSGKTHDIELGPASCRYILLEKPRCYDEDGFRYDETRIRFWFDPSLRIEIAKSRRNTPKETKKHKIYFRRDENGKWNVIVGRRISYRYSEFTLDSDLSVTVDAFVETISPAIYGEESQSAKEFLEMINKTI